MTNLNDILLLNGIGSMNQSGNFCCVKLINEIVSLSTSLNAGIVETDFSEQDGDKKKQWFHTSNLNGYFTELRPLTELTSQSDQ